MGENLPSNSKSWNFGSVFARFDCLPTNEFFSNNFFLLSFYLFISFCVSEQDIAFRHVRAVLNLFLLKFWHNPSINEKKNFCRYIRLKLQPYDIIFSLPLLLMNCQMIREILSKLYGNIGMRVIIIFHLTWVGIKVKTLHKHIGSEFLISGKMLFMVVVPFFAVTVVAVDGGYIF